MLYGGIFPNVYKYHIITSSASSGLGGFCTISLPHCLAGGGDWTIVSDGMLNFTPTQQAATNLYLIDGIEYSFSLFATVCGICRQKCKWLSFL